jgi:selenocysteine lyase/cysteine desulfurase
MEQARSYVLHYFHASPDEYEVIFTPNASGALKLVGESYPFGPDGCYLLTYDNHNSVNGIREFARARGARVRYLPVHLPDLRVDEAELAQQLAQVEPDRRGARWAPAGRLFAYPAQSNFTGVQHPLAWIEQAQAMGWDVLVDCAAFAPTNRLDLSRWRPDFVSLSFYKIFGYPTGVGCLLARKQAMAKLKRPWFAGGTITIVSVQGEGWHYLHDGFAGFEDGTVNYLNLPAVEIGLRHMESIGIETIHERVRCLTGWLLKKLAALRHSNGNPLVRIYGPTKLERRGGTIAFNLFNTDGIAYDYRRVERMANEAGISLRTGCFCNPGAGEVAYGVLRQEIAQCFQRNTPMTFEQYLTYLHNSSGKDIGALRISVGLASNFQDVYRFVAFLQRFLDR